MATSQLLNPSIPNLCEICVVSHVDVNTRKKFAGYRWAFLRYQLQDPVTKEAVTPQHGQDVEDHQNTTNNTSQGENVSLDPHSESPPTHTNRRGNDYHYPYDCAVDQGQMSRSGSRTNNSLYDNSGYPTTDQGRWNHQEQA